MILDHIEEVFKVVGDKVIMASGGYDKFISIQNFDETNELVITPRPEQPVSLKEDRISLNNMTKQQICEKSVELYGIDLMMSTEKKLLITQYLQVQELYT
jgi:hypothetical protein